MIGNSALGVGSYSFFFSFEINSSNKSDEISIITTSVGARIFAAIAHASAVARAVGVQDAFRSAGAVRISEIVGWTDTFW